MNRPFGCICPLDVDESIAPDSDCPVHGWCENPWPSLEDKDTYREPDAVLEVVGADYYGV